MTRALINSHCATLAGATVSDPWGGGHDAWKIGGKMFAVVGVMEDGVSVKCADVDTARLLIDMGRAVRAPYFHASWVRCHGGWSAITRSASGLTCLIRSFAEHCRRNYR